jgi:asparagine synthase (glutamine-hydrolysing)
MLQKMPGPERAGAESAIWTDAEAGVAIGVPAEAESPAATSVLRALPGGVTFAAAGMHGRLDSLRGSDPDRRSSASADVLATAVADTWPRTLIERTTDPLAFAIWDGRQRTALVSRDRIGHVPIYYGRAGRDFVVATHLSAFDGHPEFNGTIDPGALAGLLRHRTAPVPSTIFREVQQLTAGTILTIETVGDGIRTTIDPYWSLRDEHSAAIHDRSGASPAEISLELQHRLTHAIERSFSDPSSPVGVFFSGGVDSNLIAAVASTTGHPVHTFTSRFEAGDSDEGPLASVLAQKLGTTHHTLTITPQQLLGAIERSPAVYGQPHADQAGLAALLMAEANETPLIITGDAGNDLLGANRSLARIVPLLRVKDAIPPFAQRPLSLVAKGAAHAAERYEAAIDRLAPNSKAARLRAAGFYRLSAILEATEPEVLYRIRSSHVVSPERYITGPVNEALSSYSDRARWLGGGDRYDRWRHVELSHISIEVEGSKHERPVTAAGTGYRAPLLDAGVLPFALRVPDSVRGLNGIDRWASIDIVRRITGDSSVMPVTSGFGVPTDVWLRNELRPWAESLLSESNLRATGLFDPRLVRLEWRQHLSGQHDRRYALWPILMTLSWLDARTNRSA